VRRSFEIWLAIALALALAFFVLPLLALFFRIPPSDFIRGLRSRGAVDALLVSLKTSGIAHVFILAVGTPTAYLLATKKFFGRRLAIALVELPLVLPPAVAGIGLLAAFGRRGLVGGRLEALGVSLPFTQVAVILAIVFVASPFYIRQAIVAFESLDPSLLDAARTLGARPRRVFTRVAVPLAATGLGAGSALAFARGLGEFGATIMFAGSLAGVTQTLPLAIYAELSHDFAVAIALGGLLVVVSALILVGVKFLPSWTPSLSIAPLRFGRSGSS
jgi:molybdate transport system permease protein